MYCLQLLICKSKQASITFNKKTIWILTQSKCSLFKKCKWPYYYNSDNYKNCDIILYKNLFFLQKTVNVTKSRIFLLSACVRLFVELWYERLIAVMKDCEKRTFFSYKTCQDSELVSSLWAFSCHKLRDKSYLSV